jgi:hypothetical protein
VLSHSSVATFARFCSGIHLGSNASLLRRIIYGKKGILKWVEELALVFFLVCLRSRYEERTLYGDIARLIGDEMYAKTALVFKERVINGELAQNLSIWGRMHEKSSDHIVNYTFV